MTKSLSSILEQLSSKDIKQRQQGGTNIVDYLKSGGEVELDLLGDVVDALISGIKNSNSKISQSSITATRELLSLFGEDFKPHIHSLLPTMLEKLGDGKAGIRDEVQEFLQPAMGILSVDVVFDKVLPLFKDKNWRSREQALICLVATIGAYGINDLPMQAILANIIKVLEDPHQTVRDTAVMAVEEIYREVGEPLRAWLQQHNLRPTLLTLIYDKLNNIEPNNVSSPSLTSARTHTTHSAPMRAQTPTAPPATLSRSSSGSSVFSAGSGESERSKSGSPKSMVCKEREEETEG